MSEWIAVCGEEGDNPIEVETEDDGTLLLETLTAHFPGTTTLKYRSKDTNSFRSVKCASGILKAPSGSWDQAPLYICVNPTKPEVESRKRAAPEPAAAEVAPHKRIQNLYPEYDPTKCSDLIILGLKPTTSAAEIQDFFEKFGDVEMVQTKNSKDKNVAFAFIRFKDKMVERKVLREKHTIDDRECTIRIPDSQQGDKSLRKIYVSYHNQSLKEKEILEHFEKFGDVVEVFIPNPWRHFCFVTFHDGR
ncbi:TAR DNA-binding protein 43 [Eurytemora carolleeae]|uniref:TAR DNA-binding protein 43 n=1 Tax=Eurytemora carolleeae TaxID=1294199 RepID=UPI000C78B6C3|nr:TAR DNA-binding protein 43 [Eurytemora carolleeae]|eukprot:XP_023326983.1 TAR DNA-binding protein 43-like [Eurytemora affinis]